ncbi:hypothetical protein ACTV8E_19995 [Pseudomonas sp. B392_1p]
MRLVQGCAIQAETELARYIPEGFTPAFQALGINQGGYRYRLLIIAFDFWFGFCQVQPGFRQVFKYAQVRLAITLRTKKAETRVFIVICADVIDFSGTVLSATLL